jgi:hypothetical protein
MKGCVMAGLGSTPSQSLDGGDLARSEPAAEDPVSAQGRAYRVLGQLLDQAAARNLPAIDWTITASGERVLGRCTAYPGPGRRRADFEAWRALLGAEASEAAASREVTRLSARAESDNGKVAVEIAADLYDDPGIGAGFRR